MFATCVPGYSCEPHNNPADFFLDVINGDFTATTMTKVHGSDGNGINFNAPLKLHLRSLDLTVWVTGFLLTKLTVFWSSRRFWRMLSCGMQNKSQAQPGSHLDGEGPLKGAEFFLLCFVNISLYLLNQKVFLSPSYLIRVSNIKRRSCFCVTQLNKVVKHVSMYT